MALMSGEIASHFGWKMCPKSTSTSKLDDDWWGMETT
jgi:hypothetical protein